MSRHSPKEIERIKRIAASADFGKPVAQGSLAAPTGYASLEIKLKGETAQELWSSLLGLVCYACECKQAQDGHWPHMVSTDDGKITVRHNNRI